MSQIIFARSQHGEVLLGDSFISNIPGSNYTDNLPKAFRIGDYLYGTCGIAQLQQMVIYAGSEVKSGLATSDVEKYILDEYSKMCSGKLEPSFPRLISAEVSKKLWNPTLLVVRPCGTVFIYKDWSNAFTGTLIGAQVMDDVIVMGPDPICVSTVETRIKSLLPTLIDLAALVALVEKEIVQTSQSNASVGQPILGFTKDKMTITNHYQPQAATLQITYGDPPHTASLVDWSEP